jgi:RNA polymerase sigma-70 factor, ECF subfamily
LKIGERARTMGRRPAEFGKGFAVSRVFLPENVDPMTISSDEELLRRFRAGERNGPLDELARRHVGRVRSVIFSMVLDAADADDLAQETFCRAIRNIRSFRGASTFERWLVAIAVNTAQSFLSARARARSSPAAVLEKLPARASREPRDVLADSELGDAIRAALASLSPKLRTAIALTAIHEIPIAEAARMSRCPLPTFYWRLHRARALLQTKLAGYLKP